MGATEGWFSLDRMVAGVRELPDAIRQRAEDVRSDVLSRRARLLAQIEEQAERTVESIKQLLHLASSEEIARLEAKIGALEHRLKELDKGRAA